jgi:hypothetical protein
MFFTIFSLVKAQEKKILTGNGKSIYTFYSETHHNVKYDILKILRKDGKKDSLYSKVDYINCGRNNVSVYDRFVKFKQDHPKIIGYCSGSYTIDISGNWIPDGLSIDHGVVINRNLELNRFDALVLVYPDGAIAVSNLLNNSVNTDLGVLKIRNPDGRDKQQFIQWVQKKGCSVFQTHLLAYNNELTIKQNVNFESKRARLFLIASKDNLSGELYLYLISRTSQENLYEASRDVLELFSSKNIDIRWIINLESGSDRHFTVYDKSGLSSDVFAGYNPIRDAKNLLLFFYD